MSMSDALEGYSLAIIGSGDLIMGFAALGFQLFPATSSEECKNALTLAVKSGMAICLIQEDLYQSVKEEILIYQNQPLPVFIPLSSDSQKDILEQKIKAIRLKATGAY